MASNDLESRLRIALAEVIRLTGENERLRAENRKLRDADLEDRTSDAVDAAISTPVFRSPEGKVRSVAVNSESPKHTKIQLFRSLFKGRDDVYPVRWVSKKTGKSGYSPAVKDPWRRWRSEQNDTRDEDPDEYLPLSDQVIQDHLEGKLVAGIYPLLRDDTCHFLATDLDGESHQDDARAFAQICGELKIPVVIERSRSRNGAHLWIFFEEPIPAAVARKLGFVILSKAMEKRHEITLKSYDRLFPNQDTLPRGGFGNLIALPLQREVREKGGSVFVDSMFRELPDQWAYLATVRKMSRAQVDVLLEMAQQEGWTIGISGPAVGEEDDEDPWTRPPSGRLNPKPLSGPFPATLRIVRASLLYVQKQDLSASLFNALRRLAAFQNPEFFQHQAMRLPVYGKPRIIDCSEDAGRYLALPRGCLDQLLILLQELKIEPVIEDKRLPGAPIGVTFVGNLSENQSRAVESIEEHDIGVLSAATGFGKTVVAAAMIAKRRVSTLILVHRQQLLEQWQERLIAFLGLDRKSMGQIGAGKKSATGFVDIAMLQTMVRQGKVREEVTQYGQIIIDECHHVSAFSFEQVLRNCPAKYILGLTATPKRKDGHHPIIMMQCGPVRYIVSPQVALRENNITSEVLVRSTEFLLPSNIEKVPIHEIFKSIATSETRNSQIISDVSAAVENGRNPLILTERTEHLELLQKRLGEIGIDAIVLRGGMGKRQRKEAMGRIHDTAKVPRRVVLATGRYIGEGFDDSKLDTLFLAMPISWSGTLQQYVGRLHRMRSDKSLLQVYDYVDYNLPLLTKMFNRRSKGYKALGYTLRHDAEHPNKQVSVNFT